jgi:hypothetical protein
MVRVYRSTFRHRLEGSVGGLGGSENSDVRKFFFVGEHGSCGEDRLDRSGAFERAQFWGIQTGTSQCQIVDCSGCLSVGLVCGQGSGREKGRGIRPRDPWFVLVSLLVSVDNQK